MEKKTKKHWSSFCFILILFISRPILAQDFNLNVGPLDLQSLSSHLEHLGRGQIYNEKKLLQTKMESLTALPTGESLSSYLLKKEVRLLTGERVGFFSFTFIDSGQNNSLQVLAQQWTESPQGPRFCRQLALAEGATIGVDKGTCQALWTNFFQQLKNFSNPLWFLQWHSSQGMLRVLYIRSVIEPSEWLRVQIE